MATQRHERPLDLILITASSGYMIIAQLNNEWSTLIDNKKKNSKLSTKEGQMAQ
jgi:hypothetical protein